MQEEYKEIKRLKGFYVSNTGKIKSPKNHILKQRISDGVVIVQIDSKKQGRHTLSVAQEVYKAFKGYNEIERPKIYYKDGDKENCNIENLFICRDKPTKKQIEAFNKYAYLTAKKVAAQMYGKGFDFFDYEDYLQESVLLMWKMLSSYTDNFTSFIAWGKRYCHFAYLAEIKRAKQWGRLKAL